MAVIGLRFIRYSASIARNIMTYITKTRSCFDNRTITTTELH